MDFWQRYRAIQSRDARFDGWFVTAVRTTGIYCRPWCPATTTEARKRRVLPRCRDRAGAGYRACKRCRPDASPGSPEWNTRTDVVGRAMRLIADGLVDRKGSVRSPLASATASGRSPTAQRARLRRARPGTSAACPDSAHPDRDDDSPSPMSPLRRIPERAAVQRHRRGGVPNRTPSALRQRGAARRARHAVASARRGRTGLRPSHCGCLPLRAPFDGAGVLGFLGVRAVTGCRVSFADGVLPPRRCGFRLSVLATISLARRRHSPAPVPPPHLAMRRWTSSATWRTARHARAPPARPRRGCRCDRLRAPPRIPALAPAVAASFPGIRVPGSMEPGGDPVPGTHRATDLCRCRPHGRSAAWPQPSATGCREARGRPAAAVPDGRADRSGRACRVAAGTCGPASTRSCGVWPRPWRPESCTSMSARARRN